MYDRMILLGMQMRPGRPDLPQRHVYAGTVPWETIRKRRAADKVARHSRKVNRKR